MRRCLVCGMCVSVTGWLIDKPSLLGCVAVWAVLLPILVHATQLHTPQTPVKHCCINSISHVSTEFVLQLRTSNWRYNCLAWSSHCCNSERASAMVASRTSTAAPSNVLRRSSIGNGFSPIAVNASAAGGGHGSFYLPHGLEHQQHGAEASAGDGSQGDIWPHRPYASS